MGRTRGKKKDPPKKQEESTSNRSTNPSTRRPTSKKTPNPTPSTSAATPPTRQSKASTSKNVQKIADMRNLFNDAQHVHHINTCLERLTNIMRGNEDAELYNELKRNITFALLSQEKSPHTRNLLNFVSRFLIMQSKKAAEEKKSADEEEPMDESLMDELGLEAVGKDAFSPDSSKVSKSKKSKGPVITIVDSILVDVLIPHLTNTSQTVRLNASVIVRKVFEMVDDVENSVYRKLKRVLLERLSDKSASIRASSAKALCRFQDFSANDDLVTAAFNFHLKNDPDPDVRSSILMAIEPTRDTINEIVARTRDIKDTVRKAAYHKIAERVPFKMLSIEQRLIVIKEGLNERSAVLKKVVEKELILNWFKQCDHDLVAMLGLLDILSDKKTIDKLLNALFKSFLASASGSRTKLHEYVDSFSAAFLNERRLLTKQPLLVENVFTWRALAYFVKENETKIQPVIKTIEVVAQTEEEAEIDEMLSNIRIPDLVEGEPLQLSETASEEGSQPSPSKGPTPPKRPKTTVTKKEEIDLLDIVTPQLPHFCTFFKKFAVTVTKQEYDIDQLMDYDFIYEEFIKMLLLLEVGDEAQRDMLKDVIHDIMFLPTLTDKLTDAIRPLMKVLAINVFKDQKDLIAFTKEITAEAHNQVLEEKDVEDVVMKPEPLTPAQFRELEMKCAKLIIDIETLKDKIEELIKKDTPESFVEAGKAKKDLIKMQNEKEAIELRINQKVFDNLPLTQTDSQEKSSLTLSDFPETLFKCNQIFAGCLEYGNITKIDSFIQSHIDNLCFPGILCVSDHKVRNMAVKALGLCCTVSCTLARKYLALFLQIIDHDGEMVTNTALQAMFDFLCEFGLHEMIKRDEDLENSKSTNREKTLEGTADIDIPEPELADIDEEMFAQAPVLDEQASYETFMEKMTILITAHLGSESELIRYTTVKGTAKLMLLGKVYSPNLLTQLILLWYNPNSTTEIRHFLGVYFPIFAFQDTKFRSSAIGQSAYEECFIETIEFVYEMSRKDPRDYQSNEFPIAPAEIENMIVFITSLMTDEAQVRVSSSVCNKILDMLSKQRSDDFVYKYLFKALSCLVIDSATKMQLKDLKMLITKIEQKVSALPTARKLPLVSTRRLENISKKVDLSLELLRNAGNSSSLSLDRTITNTNEVDGEGSDGGENEEGDGEREEDDDDSASIVDYTKLNQSAVGFDLSDDQEESE